MARYLNDWALYVILGMMGPLDKATWMESPIYECVLSSIIPMEDLGCIRILGPSATPAFEPATVTFILKDRMKMDAFVDRYLQEYQKGSLVIPTGCTYYSYKNSIKETLKILREYSLINDKECTIRPIFQDGERQLKVNQKTRFYEDLLLLHRKGFIELGHVSKDLFPPNTSVREQLKTLSLSIQLRFLVSVDYMEKMLSTSQSYLGLSVSEDNEVYFKGKRLLQFTSSAKQQIELLRLLIAMQGVPVSKETVYKELKYTSKTKKAPKNEMCLDRDKKGPKSGVKKRYQERLKKLIKPIVSKLPESLKIMNTAKEGVWLQLGETEVSQ